MLALLVAGCGGGSKPQPQTAAAQQTVTGDGFRFGVAKGWQVTQTARSVTVKQGTGETLASATVLPLLKPYRPALFRKVTTELDRVTADLARKLGAKVIASRTILVAGGRVRQYDLAYSRNGTGVVDRITYVLHDKTEYELLCRWPADQGAPSACALLSSSFRLG